MPDEKKTSDPWETAAKSYSGGGETASSDSAGDPWDTAAQTHQPLEGEADNPDRRSYTVDAQGNRTKEDSLTGYQRIPADPKLGQHTYEGAKAGLMTATAPMMLGLGAGELIGGGIGSMAGGYAGRKIAEKAGAGEFGQEVGGDIGGAGGGVIGSMAGGLARPDSGIGRVATTAAKGVENFDVTKPFKSMGQMGEYWRQSSPLGRMISKTNQAVAEGRATELPTKLTPARQLKLDDPLMADTKNAVAGRRAAMIPIRARAAGEAGGTGLERGSPTPFSTFVPEPRPTFNGENPNYMGSVPREELEDLALRRKPGAGHQMQQLGKPIIYIPNGSDLP